MKKEFFEKAKTILFISLAILALGLVGGSDIAAADLNYELAKCVSRGLYR